MGNCSEYWKKFQTELRKYKYRTLRFHVRESGSFFERGVTILDIQLNETFGTWKRFHKAYLYGKNEVNQQRTRTSIRVDEITINALLSDFLAQIECGGLVSWWGDRNEIQMNMCVVT